MKSVFVLLSVCCCVSFALMTKVALNQTAIDNGAVCLDGTGGIYYFKAGSETNKTKWVLHLLGGGLCMEADECLVRSKTLLGSSNGWPAAIPYGGPLSEDPEYNPDFHDWNHVFFAYCDGASFSGDKEEPVTIGNATLYFRGHRILVATIEDLLANKGLDNATDVLLVGDSAGGMAAFFHADEIKSMLPDSVTRFKAAPFSGVFLDRPNVEGKYVFRENMRRVYENHECKSNANCEAAQASNETFKCFFAQYVMDYVETPLFVLDSASDKIGITCVALGEPVLGVTYGTGNCSAVPGWEACEADSAHCTHEQWALIEEYAQGFRETIEKHNKLNQDGNGLFEYDCYSHAIEAISAWPVLMVNGTLMRDAVGKWFFSDNEPSSQHMYKDCINHESYTCNPTCPDENPSSSSSKLSSSSKVSSSSGSTPKPSSSASASSSLYPKVAAICVAFMALYHALL